MTNLEWLKTRDLITTSDVYKGTLYGTGQIGINLFIKLRDSDYSSYKKKGIDWLLEEHKEPIKLKQWEKDLLASLYNTAEDRFVYMGVFKYHAILRNMKLLGHFKGVTDEDMSLAKILDDCEVVE